MLTPLTCTATLKRLHSFPCCSAESDSDDDIAYLDDDSGFCASLM